MSQATATLALLGLLFISVLDYNLSMPRWWYLLIIAALAFIIYYWPN